MKEVHQRGDEGMLVADDVSWRPKAIDIRMPWARDENASLPLSRSIVAQILILKMVHMLKVKLQRSNRPIDLEGIPVLVAGGKS